MPEVGYTVREAVSSDKVAVLRINENVYCGDDYLQHCYDSWMEISSGYTSYVYEQNGVIIGFLATYIVDDGETAMDRAGRVRPEFIGTGVYRRLIAEVEKIHREHGQIQRRVLTTEGEKSESFMRKYTRVASRAFYVFRFAIETYRKLEKASESLSVQQLPDSIPPAFLQAPYANYLFPDKRVIVRGRSFRLLEANIPLMKDDDTVFTSNLQYENATFSGILTAGTIFKTVNGSIYCVVDVYGSDFSSILYHVECHMRRVRAKQVQSVVLSIYPGIHVSLKVMHSLFQKVGLEGRVEYRQNDVYECSINSEGKLKEQQAQ